MKSTIDFRLQHPDSSGDWVPGDWNPLGTPGHDYFSAFRKIPASSKAPTVSEFVCGYQPVDKRHVSMPFLVFWRGEVVRHSGEKLVIVKGEKVLPLDAIGLGVLEIIESTGNDGLEVVYSAPQTETELFDEESWQWKHASTIPAFCYSATLYKGQTVCVYAHGAGLHKKPVTWSFRDTEW